MKRLLVADIDGTIAHDDHVPEEVVSVCETLGRAGWEIVVATGRILASAERHIRSIGAASPAIVYDGARIMDSVSGNDIWSRELPPCAVRDVLDLSWGSRLGIQVFGDEAVLCKKNDTLALRYFNSIGVPVDEGLDSPRCVEGVYRVILYGDPSEAERMGTIISQAMKGRVRAVLAGNGFLDILAPGVSKGAALEELIASLHESERPFLIAAAGDHLNDLELLEYADIAITMKGARKELLDIADIVLPPAAEGGFSQIAEPLDRLASAFICP